MTRALIEANPGQLWAREDDEIIRKSEEFRLRLAYTTHAYRPCQADGKTPMAWDLLKQPVVNAAGQVVGITSAKCDVSRVPTLAEIEAHDKAHGGRWKSTHSPNRLSLWVEDGKALGWYSTEYERPDCAWALTERQAWLAGHNLQPMDCAGNVLPWPAVGPVTTWTAPDLSVTIKDQPLTVSSLPISLDTTGLLRAETVKLSPEAAKQIEMAVRTAVADKLMQPKEEKTMPTISIPVAGTPLNPPQVKKSRNRRAIDKALFGAPVEWTIDQAHEFVVYLLDRDLMDLPKEQREIIQGWAIRKLKSPYGKAALGILAGNVAPIAAAYLAKAESIVEEASDKMLEYAYTTAFKEAGTDVVKFIGKPGLRKLKALYNGMTKGVERAEKVRARQIEAPLIDPLAALKDEPITSPKQG